MGNAASSASSPGGGPSSTFSPPPPPPPPAALPEEVIEDILLRLPPDEPASLFRAALVCKPWCRLISGSRFRRRYSELHRTPPMLGFLCNTSYDGSRFVPTIGFCPPGTCRFDWEALDAHHGRVLGKRFVPDTEGVFVVWDPITDEQWEITFPRLLAIGWSAAVLCAGTATGACNCNHIDCHGEPFLVVFVGCDPAEMFVCTYSSDVKSWSEPVSTEHPDPVNWHFVGPENHPVLVGNALYFGIGYTNLNLKYNLESHKMYFIQLPSTYKWSYLHHCMLTNTDEGVLGLITVDYSKPQYGSKLTYKLCIWLMDSPEVDAGWRQSRAIDLKTVLPHGSLFISPNVVGVTDGLGTVFMMVESDLYTIDLKTSMVELYQYQDIGIKYIIPYMSFYTPEIQSQNLNRVAMNPDLCIFTASWLVRSISDGFVPQGIAEALLISDPDTASLLFFFVCFTFLNDSSIISMVLLQSPSV